MYIDLWESDACYTSRIWGRTQNLIDSRGFSALSASVDSLRAAASLLGWEFRIAFSVLACSNMYHKINLQPAYQYRIIEVSMASVFC